MPQTPTPSNPWTPRRTNPPPFCSQGFLQIRENVAKEAAEVAKDAAMAEQRRRVVALCAWENSLGAPEHEVRGNHHATPRCKNARHR